MAVLAYNELVEKKMKRDLYLYQEEKDGTIKVTGMKASIIANDIAAQNIFLYATAPNGSRGTLYIYQDGVYVETKEERLNRIVYDFVSQLDVENLLRPAKIQQIVDLIKININTVYYDELNSNMNLINFKNGILDLRTMTLKEHTPDFLSTIQVPTNWNPDFGETPKFDSFLNDLTLGMVDPENCKKLLTEFIGIAISNVPGYNYKTSLLLYGPGGTGKTQYRNLITKLIGQNNTQHVELRDLERDFVTGGLYGKRMFGSDDMSYAHSRDLSNFKSITGGGPMLISQKFKDSFSSILTGVFVNCANDLPLFGGDKGVHVYKRIMPLKCTNVIPEEKINRYILNEIMAEAEGICFKAVKALMETEEAGFKVTVPEEVKNNWKYYRKANDLAIEFYETYCVDVGDERPSTQAEIRRCFKNWCKHNYNVVPQKDEFERSVTEYLGYTDTESIKNRTSLGRYYTFDISQECFETYFGI